ncbi:AAA family ATPase [Maridesulfovibrio sp.]|uniref:AAA family ATPase n=1 Tax=unclassified Maridesulfovibrio TaxID=2794999 RepID=UPI003B002184
MYLEKLSLHNYRGIRDMEIEFDRHLNVFVGDNGCGKSSIISAIGNGLFGSRVDHFVGEERNTYETLLFIYNHQIFENEEYAKFCLNFIYDDKKIEVVCSSEPDEISSTLKKQFPRVDFLDFTIFEEDRGVGLIENEPDKGALESLRKIDPRLSVIANRNAAFNHAFDWIKKRESYEDSLFRKHILAGNSIDDFSRDAHLKFVKDAIVNITGFLAIDFNIERGVFEVVKEYKGKQVTLGLFQLSLGERVFIGLIAAIAYSFVLSSELNKKIDAEHLIIIDEIDLHLHPKWQRRIVPALRETFPNCQFIITTHSPQVLSEVPAENIFSLYRDEDGDIRYDKPVRSKGLTSSEILTEVMDVSDINDEVAATVNEIYICIENEEFDKARGILDDLESELGQIPALIEARTVLDLSE